MAAEKASEGAVAPPLIFEVKHCTQCDKHVSNHCSEDESTYLQHSERMIKLIVQILASVGLSHDNVTFHVNHRIMKATSMGLDAVDSDSCKKNLVLQELLCKPGGKVDAPKTANKVSAWNAAGEAAMGAHTTQKEKEAKVRSEQKKKEEEFATPEARNALRERIERYRKEKKDPVKRTADEELPETSSAWQKQVSVDFAAKASFSRQVTSPKARQSVRPPAKPIRYYFPAEVVPGVVSPVPLTAGRLGLFEVTAFDFDCAIANELYSKKRSHKFPEPECTSLLAALLSFLITSAEKRGHAEVVKQVYAVAATHGDLEIKFLRPLRRPSLQVAEALFQDAPKDADDAPASAATNEEAIAAFFHIGAQPKKKK